MSLIFESISYKNFLSSGNAPTKIELNRTTTTIIIGKNGAGKSTILDALTFVLFGKPFRNINRGQVVNSINCRQCEVTLDLYVDNVKYKIIRGIKPNIFEIWKNGELLNKDASVKDYQSALENQILKLNFKLFTQVIILGSSSYVSFMNLSVANRRDVIEDILDIKIFSTMNSILKDKISTTKIAISDIDTSVKIIKNKIESQKTIIDLLSQSHTDKINTLNLSINENETTINDLEHSNRLLNLDIKKYNESILDRSELLKHVEVIKNKRNITIAEKSQHIKDISFFEDKTDCPTCKQGIKDEHKESILNDLNNKALDNLKSIEAFEITLNTHNETLKKYEEVVKLISSKESEYSSNNNTIKFLKQKNSNLLLEVEKLENNTGDVDIEKNKLKELSVSGKECLEKKKILLEDQSLQEVAGLLLKDNGIKTAIIREYLPVMNTLINKYLHEMDTYIHFELDENFNEIIKSRYRDEFTYASFSEGEKQKIDIALLFTWRHIAQMKNSVNTNLLIMDEIFDASLDSTGTELLMQVLDSLSKNTNIFVISHKGDLLLDKFDATIKFEKRNEFSVICD